MGTVQKGIIAIIEGNTARVMPSEAGARVSAKLVIPWHLRGSYGALRKGMAVIYAEFPDGTGMILERADGEGGFLN